MRWTLILGRKCIKPSQRGSTERKKEKTNRIHFTSREIRYISPVTNSAQRSGNTSNIQNTHDLQSSIMLDPGTDSPVKQPIRRDQFIVWHEAKKRCFSSAEYGGKKFRPCPVSMWVRVTNLARLSSSQQKCVDLILRHQPIYISSLGSPARRCLEWRRNVASGAI